MDLLQYLTGLVGADYATEIVNDGLPESDIDPLSEDEITALERKAGTALPEEVREFLRMVGTAGIMDASRFESFETALDTADNLLRIWLKSAGAMFTFEEYLAEEVGEDVSRSEAQKRYASYEADFVKAEDLSTRAILLREDEFEGGWDFLDPENGHVYNFALQNCEDSAHGMDSLGPFREWVATSLQ